MSSDIRESDWKVFRELHDTALDRFCAGVLEEIGGLADNAHKSSHKRYLAVLTRIRRRNKELAAAFNDMRRSTALLQLALIKSRGLLTDAEFARFSDELRDRVSSYLRLARS